MEKYTIPRNINVKEVVAYGLTGKQIIYLGLGIGGALLPFSVPILPLCFKISGGIFSMCGSLALTLTKMHGQETDRYIANSIKYPFRNKEYGGENNGNDSPILHIR